MNAQQPPAAPPAPPPAPGDTPPAPGDTPPVFADPSGRRPRRMRLAGIAAGGVLLTCLAIMAVGLLGGPQASLIPWSDLNAAHSAAPAAKAGISGEASAAPVPTPTVLPQATSPAARPRGAASGSGTATTAAPGATTAAATSATPSPVVTNRASKTPPGQNRSPSPHPTRRNGL